MLAPVGSLEPWEVTLNTLEFSGNKATWLHANDVFREYTLDDEITLGVLTTFDEAQCVVLVCNDLVYTFSEFGSLGCIGLQFSPEIAVACSDGVILQFNQKLYLISDPNNFVGLVAPSSTSAIVEGDRLISFDQGLAVFESLNGIKVFGIRKVQPRVSQKSKRSSLPRRHSLLRDTRIMSGTENSGQISSLTDLELQKEAIITFLHKLKVQGPVQLITQRLENKQALYMLENPDVLHILIFTNGKVRHERLQARAVVALAGFSIGNTFPMVLLQTDKFVLYNGFFEMGMDLDLEPSGNNLIRAAGKNTFYLGSSAYFVDCHLDNLAGQCFEIIADLLEAEATLNWLLVYMGHLQRVQNSWSAFVLSVVTCLSEEEEESKFDYSYAASHIILCLHLFREDLLLGTHMDDLADRLGQLLAFVTSCAGWDWAQYYEIPAEFTELPRIAAVKPSATPPNIYFSLSSMLGRQYIEYPSVMFERTNSLLAVFQVLANPEASIDNLADVLKGMTLSFDQFAECIRIPLLELWGAVQRQGSPSQQQQVTRLQQVQNLPPLDVVALLFPKDRRFHEARQLLNHLNVAECSLVQPNTASDHEWVELLAQYQKPIVVKTLSLAFGSGPVYFCSKVPFVSERLVLPELEFKMLLTETEVQVTFDVQKHIPSELVAWSYFHQGIATGLAVARDAKITSSWIVYNKIDGASMGPRHAGFLLGLGLNGHLTKLEEWHTYNYMNNKDPMTSIALLIGLSASSLGLMDSKLTKVLSLHIPALLPPGSNDLNVHSDAQIAAVFGVGLLYFDTKYRRMSEVFVSEICKSDASGLYPFACGVATGFINIAKGNEFVGVVDQLLIGRLQQAASHISDKTSRGAESSVNAATMALMLTFLQCNNKAIAQTVAPPKSVLLSTYSPPSLVFTRALATNLIMWDSIGCSREWIQSQIPPELLPRNDTLDSSKLCYFNVLGGTAAALALRYAGTQNPQALEAVVQVIDELTEWTDVPLDEYGQLHQPPECLLAVTNAQYALASVVMAAATIAVSSGNLDLLRRLRILQNRKYGYLRPHTLYNLQVAISQAIGMLFMGGCLYSFDSSPKTIGILALSVGLLSDAGHNIINWQLLRSVWALVAKRSCLVLRDETGAHVNEKVMINGVLTTTPALVPELQSIEFAAPGYLPLSVMEIPPSGEIFVEFQHTLNVPSLETSLAGATTSQLSPLIEFLERLSLEPHRPVHMWSLHLLFVFADFWTESLTTIPERIIDKLKLNVWRAKQKQLQQ